MIKLSTLNKLNTEISEDANSQVFKAQLRLREMILAGVLKPGSRVTELAMVERLGISRTSIRTALMRLEQEGLIEALASGGFAVRIFSERDVADAIELRGTIEGLAARQAAEQGTSEEILDEAKECLDQIDQLLKGVTLSNDNFTHYGYLNRKFHQLIGELSGSQILMREIEKICRFPFASPSGFVVAQVDSPKARDMLIVAQDQHRQVLDAIERSEGGRAESIMREHSRLARRNLHDVLKAPETMPEAWFITKNLTS